MLFVNHLKMVKVNGKALTMGRGWMITLFSIMQLIYACTTFSVLLLLSGSASLSNFFLNIWGRHATKDKFLIYDNC